MISRRKIIDKQRKWAGTAGKQSAAFEAETEDIGAGCGSSESENLAPKLGATRRAPSAGRRLDKSGEASRERPTSRCRAGAPARGKLDEQHDELLDDALAFDKRRAPLKMARQFDDSDEDDIYQMQGAGRGKPQQQPAGHNFDPYSIYGEDDEEDVWYSEEKLFEDHIQEIADKWLAIDDEIWAKIICMERNRRIAKAYARKRAITVNGSEEDYSDGTMLGLNSFDNPDRDSKTSNIKQYIGEGVRIKINASGDIFLKRLCKANVFVHQLSSKSQAAKQHVGSEDSYALTSATDFYYGVAGARETPSSTNRRLFRRQFTSPSLSLSAGKDSSAFSGHARASTACQPSGKQSNTGSTTQSSLLELERVVKVFNMDKFKETVEREAKQAYPNHTLLRNMCISVVSFVIDDRKLLNMPSWIMIINMVAIDLLTRKIGLSNKQQFGSHDFTIDSSARLVHCANRARFLNRDKQVEEDELYRKFNGLSRTRSRFELGALAGASASTTDDYYRIQEADDDDDDDDEQQEATMRDNSRPVLLRSNSNFQLRDVTLGERSGSKPGTSSDGGRSAQDDPAPSDGVGAKLQAPGDGGLSSSSGFNSHSSLQNDDSTSASQCTDANSSASSNLAPSTGQQSLDRGDYRQPVYKVKRGKRPPKLPHGVSSPALVSDPIPIPAPPTSLGGPSGKANLILVSPTGLSPPLPKRELGGQMTNKLSCALRDSNSGALQESSESVEASKAAKKALPVGIPAHAQLAPPATQRHILRYLMSAVTRGGNEVQRNKPLTNNRLQTARSQLAKGAAPPVAMHSFQAVPPQKRTHRPLPVLPGQRPARQTAIQQNSCLHVKHKSPVNCSDDSLYYSGLQARVPKHSLCANRNAALAQPLGGLNAQNYQYPITKSAIQAILTDFKLQSNYQLSHLQQCRDHAIATTHCQRKQPSSLAKLRKLSHSASALVQNGFKCSKTLKS